VAQDLAIQAAGLLSVPVTDLGKARERGARAWAAPAGSAGPEFLDHVALPAWNPFRDTDFPDRPAGGVMTEREVTQEELIAAVDRLEIEGEGREIVVIGRAPERWADRVFFSWATVNGAWARPTVFHGTAAELRALRRAVEEEKPPFWERRAGRLPFGRLRVVLCEELAEEERRFWEGRGVLSLGAPASRRPS
jgi:hypothetical protein